MSPGLAEVYEMYAGRILTQQDSSGWTAGLRNMLQKENAKWWNWKSLLAQLIIWTVIINGLVAVSLFVMPHIATGDVTRDLTREKVVVLGLQTFFQVTGLAVVLGAIIMSHDAILKERESGTAAWLLSKPLSRKAFVLSKVIACGVGVMVVVLLAQGIITYVLCSAYLGSPVAMLPFLAGLGIIGLNILFYLVMALAISAFTTSRGVALGIPVLVALTGSFTTLILPDLYHVMPWGLTYMAQDIATSAFAQVTSAANPVSSVDYLAIVATAVWALIFTGAAVRRFEQIEL